MAASTRCADVLVPSPQGHAVESSSKLALPLIPDELVIFSILARLPAKPIVRFKSVCKDWLAVLSSRRFIDANLEFSKARPVMLIVPGEVREQWRGWRTTFWMGYYRYDGGDVAEALDKRNITSSLLLAMSKKMFQDTWPTPLHCDGLVAVTTYDQITVCNPATREFLAVHKASTGIGFGRDPSTMRYKLVCAFYEDEVIDGQRISVLRLEVLTLGTDASRRIADPPRLRARTTPVHVRGFIYWPANSGVNDSLVLAAFSLADETFSETPFPPCKPGEYVHCTELEGGLCSVVVAGRGQDAKIWTCDGTDEPAWTLRFTIQLPQETITTAAWLLQPPRFTFQGKDILISGGRNLYRYNSETGEMTKVDVAIEDLRYYHPESNCYKEFLGDGVAFRIVHGYVESLVQIRGAYNNTSVKQRVFSVLARSFDRTCNLITGRWAAAVGRH